MKLTDKLFVKNLQNDTDLFSAIKRRLRPPFGFHRIKSDGFSKSKHLIML